ncbi:MAG: amidase [Ectothiorhodospiraceae bacterium]|nr:amidase [Chromatiales bacterium]MCP5153749.1 amidase [Ectothiorhodospiraceae bacterium]
MTDHATLFAPITELARRMREDDLSPVELTETYLERIGALDPTLHAFVKVCPERARAEARAAEGRLRAGCPLGPLDGIPYVAKDLFDVRGEATRAGTHLLADNVKSEDCTVVRRLAQSGMVLLGKTHTVQFAYGGAGINHDEGTPHNPWDRVARLPGGSSSGTGVAVAAGLAPAGLGSDTGGSVRIPASFCGVTGLKTTVGEVSRAGVYPLSASLDSVGPLTRDARDAALLFEAMRGADPADPSTLGHGDRRPLGDVGGPLDGLRVAFAETVFFDDVEPAVEQAVRAAGDVFRSLGATVGSLRFPEAEETRRLNPRGLVIAAEAYAFNRRLVDEHFDALDPVVGARIVLGKDIPAHEYFETTLAWQRLRARARAALRDVDVLLCPTVPMVAPPVAETDRDSSTYGKVNILTLRNTSVGNILGLCGLSVPCGFDAGGLPIGLMLYGKAFDESTVLRAGIAYQSRTDWHRRMPDLRWAHAAA